MDENFKQYLSGEKLYGDDFSPEQILEWYKEEKNAYYKLGQKSRETYQYGYHALNFEHGFAYLQGLVFRRVLSIGGGYGDELQPIYQYIEEIVIIESAVSFLKDSIKDPKISLVESHASGELPFNNCQFDLVTCFGTLHHIPNVSKIINEIYRVLRKDGFVLMREPITSMGDWRKPRKGLTKQEKDLQKMKEGFP